MGIENEEPQEVTLNRHWLKFRGSIAGSVPVSKLMGLKYVFYAGAISYHNIMMYINSMEGTSENKEFAIEIIEHLAKELEEYVHGHDERKL